MKKKISLLGLVLILIFCFTGCGKSDTTEYDETELAQYSELFVQWFSSMSDQEFSSFSELSDLELNLALMQTGFPVEGDSFLGMMSAWQAGVSECGSLVSMNNFEMTTGNDGATLTAEAKFEDRDATIAIVFDESMNMENLTISAEYSTGEILQKAGMNTILGMGTVFVVLIFLSFVIYLLKFIPVLEKKLRKTPEKSQEADAEPFDAPTEPETHETADDAELAAVIAAAVAASEGVSADGFVVRSIKRRKTNRWN